MKTLPSILFLSLLAIAPLYGQEFNAQVSINSEKIDGSMKQIFIALQEKLTEFINNRKFTEAQFSVNEKINCNITLLINQAESNERFKGEIHIQANRPVFNATYVSPTLNTRDTQFTFNFTEFQQLEYNPGSFDSNLVMVVVFYLHIILGIDFDTFSPQGGTPFFEQAMNIANMAQSVNEPGWKAFDTDKNRYSLASDMVDEGSTPYRQMIYLYHRLGLDQMALSVEKGRRVIGDALPALNEIYTSRPHTMLITLFAETKLDELLNIYSKAPQEEREAVHKLLSSVYPTYQTRLEPLKQSVR